MKGKEKKLAIVLALLSLLIIAFAIRMYQKPFKEWIFSPGAPSMGDEVEGAVTVFSQKEEKELEILIGDIKKYRSSEQKQRLQKGDKVVVIFLGFSDTFISEQLHCPSGYTKTPIPGGAVQAEIPYYTPPEPEVSIGEQYDAKLVHCGVYCEGPGWGIFLYNPIPKIVKYQCVPS